MADFPTMPAAAELSEQEQDERAQSMYALEADIKAALTSGREATWLLARSCHEFDEANGWTALGYEKIGDWLADPEISMQRRTFYRLTSVYRELVVQRKIPTAGLKELDVSKVDIVMGSVKAGRVKLSDALEDVKALGARDLRDKYMRRPDPAEAGTSSEEASQAAVTEPEYDPPMNPTDDVPRRASDVPAHNTDTSGSGQDSVIEGTAVEVYKPVGYDESGDVEHAVRVCATLRGAIAGGQRSRQLHPACEEALAFIVKAYGLDDEAE